LWQERLESVFQRLDLLISQAAELMTDAERDHVNLAGEQLEHGLGGPYGAWIRDLRDGRCRLPELQPTVMKDLLLTWLSPEVDGGLVCKECGLEYPKHKSPPLSQWKLLPGKKPMEEPGPWYDLPEFFRACPNCGAVSYSGTDWPHQVRNYNRPWKELDGYVGREGDPRRRLDAVGGLREMS
jgi:hypothetical protein